MKLVLPRWQPFRVTEIVRSIPEKMNNDEIQSHVDKMVCIRQANIEQYSYHFDKPLPPFFRSQMHYAQRHVYFMKDVYVNPRTGSCYAKQWAFQESYGSLRRWLIEVPATKEWGELVIDRPATCINCTGFAHFLMEELPRLLWAIETAGKDIQILLPNRGIPKFIDGIIAELISERKMEKEPLRITRNVVVLKHFIFTQAEAYSGFWHHEDISILRSTFLKTKTKESPERMVYISRRNSTRAFDNEKKLEESLADIGFECVQLENLSFREQRSLFSGASIIVGNHGAGLANLVWCTQGTQVIEIFSPRWFNDCFARLTSQVRCKYYPIWAMASNSWGVVDTDLLIDMIGKAITEPHI